ncbi:sepiapterin reductase-like [Pecten maximus]|uniref:sepiapterin reductase-like n=1 Tax=Pecten maximus TaxID=6579 RepID=UPI001457F6FF|nr:sepiapterin reductase-like [Pecten maximus]
MTTDCSNHVLTVCVTFSARVGILYFLNVTRLSLRMATPEPAIMEKRSFVVITGVGRGLGRSIASKFVEKLPLSSLFVFLSPSDTGQESLVSELLTSRPGVRIRTQTFDQGEMDQNIFDNIFVDILKNDNLESHEFDQVIIVHNSAIVGDVTKWTWDLTEVTSLVRLFDVNIVGMILLNSSFLKTFSDVSSRIIVNVTSGNAIRPYKTMSTYCAAKAARDMFFRVLSSEDPTIRVLTYSPGHVDTDMLTYVRDNTIDKDLADKIRAAYTEGRVVTGDASADRLMAILEKNTFENASYVAFADPL